MSSTTGTGEYLPKCTTCEVREQCRHPLKRRTTVLEVCVAAIWPGVEADQAAAEEEA